MFFSTIKSVYYLLPLLGLIIGLFGVMLGGGGGFFLLPVLTLGLNVPAQTAVTTTLVSTLPICAVGSWGHFKRGNINVKIGAVFALIGIIGAFAGACVTSIITAGQLKTGFGIYTILIALNIVIASRQETKKKETEEKILKRKLLPLKRAKSGFFALTAGMITGVFGTSGTAPILASLFNMRIPLKVVIGTSLLVVFVNTLFAISAHFFVSRIDMTLVALLTTGSVLGAIIGTKLLAKSNIEKSGKLVQYIYASVMAVIGLLMIAK